MQRGSSGPVKRSQGQDAQGRWEITAREAAVRQLIKIEEEGLFAGHPTDSSNLMVLRLALYELEYESLALHALDEHVGLARKVTPASAKYAPGFVNAVLREAGRRVQAGTLPSPKDELDSMIASAKASERNLARGLSLIHSHPTWLASRWLKRFGREEAEALMEQNNKPPVYTVRVNPLRGITVEGLLARFAEEGVDARASSTLPHDFVEVYSGLQTVLAKGFVARGECLVQDVSAGLVVAAALDPQPGERVLDACAAPGGKTMFCASKMQGKGHLTALDTSASRLQALGRQAEAAGVPKSMISMRAVDLRVFAKEVAGTLNEQQVGMRHRKI
ncbi:S-adenosyl-L-methionine-dependent methyltransferase [Dunaliella salina]|uniref:S-adenosyl-L-methionine-dependent methyltransferase n=1 Tax=Dunaliella salina TaxID=3046 RepID=A0ABQ7GBL2_DUNSA|nr:S-adenosyl-L-methionine-dependent methyltransferase [Dunaliella salina]|eukprot:KAF5831999.1 S-adenosyl-L-methionine-dependent methyltransferase [Dunaliella salina]